MKKSFEIIITALVLPFIGQSQVFDIDTIQYRGDINKYINFVILGDGYTSSQQTKFIKEATSLTNYFFSQSPYNNYTTYCNVFAIKVVSADSGAKHPNTAGDCAGSGVPVANPNTYFGSTFDYAGIHRLVVPTKTSNLVNVLASNFPSYDQVLVLVNSSYYGGSGGEYATSTVESNADEILIHEVGHSFANLADEYWAGASYARERPNMTQQSNPTLVKWKNWLNAGTGIGIYPHSGDATWYKPHQSCKMQYLNVPFCSVCKEATIEEIHNRVNPIVLYSPKMGTVSTADPNIDFKLIELMKPVPNCLKTVWTLNGTVIAKNKDSVKINQSILLAGSNKLTVTVVDTNVLLKVNTHETVHVNTVEWNIQKMVTGIEVNSLEHKVVLSLYPNPAQDYLIIETQGLKEDLSIEIISAEGKYHSVGKQLLTTAIRLDVSALPLGVYTVILKGNSILHEAVFVKK